MKLQKQLSRKVGKIEYSKYVITISPQLIEKLGWTNGDEIDPKIKDQKLVLKKK